MLLHKTLNDEGELVCFTMVSLADDFSFLAYMATNPAKRSGGWGTKHLQRLIEILKLQFPTHIGMYLEIEATDPKTITLTPAEDVERKRRLSFYITKCRAKRVCTESLYLTPSKTDPGKEWEGELLCIDFGNVQSQCFSWCVLIPPMRFSSWCSQFGLISRYEPCKTANS
jgi:hypothetical protein